MVVSTFFVLNKDGKKRYYKKSFLLADLKPNIVFAILFLTITNANIDFQTRDLE